MKKFEGWLLCSDLDGTFEFCRENFEAIDYFRKNGGRFTVTSGRNSDYIRKIEGLRSDVPAVILNGALVCDIEKDETIYRSLLGDCLYEVLEYVSYDDNIDEVYVHTGQESMAYALGTKLPERGWSKVVFVERDEAAAVRLKDKLKEKFSDRLSIFRSWSRCVEVLPCGQNKGTAVRFLVDYLGDVTKLICVGDYENDIDMIAAADIGFAVENAIDEVKAVADVILPPFNENAIVHLIKYLDELGVRS